MKVLDKTQIGCSYAGLMEYKHRPGAKNPGRGLIPKNFREDLIKAKFDPSNLSRTRLDVPGLGGM